VAWISCDGGTRFQFNPLLPGNTLSAFDNSFRCLVSNLKTAFDQQPWGSRLG
jgi:hypothetical protein